MFLFSVSSFIDLLNALVCFALSRKLAASYRRSRNELVYSFSFFYLLFAVFFLFLGLPFFIQKNPALIQTSFVIAHLFLYLAIAAFLGIILRLVGMSSYSYFVSALVVIAGVAVFVFSLMQGGEARFWVAALGFDNIISWSHGGSLWVRLLIGTGGTALGVMAGVFFFFSSARFVQDAAMRAKGKFLGAGLFLLGLASFLAFILSALSFYNFWIVFLAELLTISGLLMIYQAISLQKYEPAGKI